MSKARKKPLRFTHLRLQNWRNFTQVDVDLQGRVFLLGPNASGKSNLLDVFRFLHDIASIGGGFLAAVGKPWRGGFSKLKSLTGRHHADIGIEVHMGNDKSPRQWEYELHFAQEAISLPKIKRERVVKQGKELKRRPDRQDDKDPLRLTQTYLEQVSVNQDFRELAEFFTSVSYLHLVPQVVRRLIYAASSEDPFGGSLLRRIADLPEKERTARLRLIRDALRAAVPQLKELQFSFDPVERQPHLQSEFEHLQGALQQEDQFSDGTLRLIGMIWSLLDGTGPLLLEEPELSLHPALLRVLPWLFYRIADREPRQVMVSTHSPELLREEGIGLNEVLLLQPGPEGTSVQPAGSFEQIQTLVSAGLNLDEAVMPHTSPPKVLDMALLGA
ncbi:MAG TPA: AAA family ATPase [Gemmataceae bacterium]|jgi:predicted ATPase|nr:AAA family ATPase [Gemmataceae bacterium]